MTDTPPDATSPNRLRRSGRIILLDDEDRVLLIRFVLPRRTGDYQFWATPGGEIEGEESPLDTARRELGEELGLDLPLAGPVHHASGTFEFFAETVDNADDFYLARWPGGPITLDGVDEAERRALKEVRWWSADAIDAAPDPIYPPDLSDVVRRLAAGPAAPSDQRQDGIIGDGEPAPGGLPPYRSRRSRTRSLRPGARLGR